MLATLPIDPRGEIAWDDSRQLLWAVTHGFCTSYTVDLLDPITGGVQPAIFATGSGCSSERKALTHDACDDTVWFQDETWDAARHTTPSGVELASVGLRDSTGNTRRVQSLCAASGDLLYVLDSDKPYPINRVRKSDGAYLSELTSFPGVLFLVGLECDPVNFAPKVALWTRTSTQLYAVEADPGACWCGPEPMPDDLGNSLRAVRSGSDVRLSWDPDPTPGVGVSTSIRRGQSKGVWSGSPALTGLAGPPADLADIAAPPSLYFYRVLGVGCTGVEGP